MPKQMPSKDEDDIEPYFFVWCDPTGLNDGSVNDNGELQGEVIDSYTVTPESGLTVDSHNKDAVTIHGTDYLANTVVTVWLSGGTQQVNYKLRCHIVTSGSPTSTRELDRTMVIPIREH